MRLVRFVMAMGAIGCICLSCHFAFEFGWTRGSTLRAQWMFAMSAAFLDLAKSGMLILTAGATRLERRAAALAFWFLTAMSLWCAGGMTATQLAERITNKTIATIDYSGKEAALKRLQGQRDQMVFTATTQEVVDAAQEAANEAERQRREECENRGRPGRECRRKEAAKAAADTKLTNVKAQKALTDAAVKLDGEAHEAERILRGVDLKTVNRQADPQSESMAKVFGVGSETIALIGHMIFAIGVEIGSGLLPWLLFGHGTRAPQGERGGTAELRAAQMPVLVPMQEKPRDIIERFFAEVVRHALNSRVQSLNLYSGFVQWCLDRGIEPMSHAMFGRLARWPKGKIGGVVWYLDCEIAEGYAGLMPPRATRPLAMLTAKANGSLATH